MSSLDQPFASRTENGDDEQAQAEHVAADAAR